MCFTEVKKKQKAKGGKNKGQVRTITKQVPKPSFFHFFKVPEQPSEEEEEEEENEEEGRINLTPDEDYDVGHMIRTAVIPNGILYFVGENEDGYDFATFGEDGDDEGDEDDEDEDDEDEEDTGKGKKKGFAKTGGAQGANAEKPECKQN